MRLGRLGILVMATAMNGCTGYRDPSAQVFSAGVALSSDEAAILDLTLELTNPNKASLKLLDVEYDVMIDGVHSYTGVRSAEATLAGHDQRRVRLPVVIRLHDAGLSADSLASAGYSITGRVRYIAPGELARMFRDMGVPNPAASFAGRGAIQTH